MKKIKAQHPEISQAQLNSVKYNIFRKLRIGGCWWINKLNDKKMKLTKQNIIVILVGRETNT